MRWLCLVIAGPVLAGLACGCSSSAKVVLAKGQLVSKGQPYRGNPKGSVTIVFTPETDGGENFSTYPATFQRDDATFTVPGTDGRGIPEGKYRIAINQLAIPMPAEITRMNEQFSTQKTGIVREVKSADETIVIDLGKPGG